MDNYSRKRYFNIATGRLILGLFARGGPGSHQTPLYVSINLFLDREHTGNEAGFSLPALSQFMYSDVHVEEMHYSLHKPIFYFKSRFLNSRGNSVMKCVLALSNFN